MNNTRTVRTQTELDEALADPDVSLVEIRSERGVWLIVTALGSATVTALGSATVRAYGSATVHAGAYVAVHVHWQDVTVEGGHIIDMTAINHTDPATWCELHGIETTTDNTAVLYKAVDTNYQAGHAYTLTTYTPGTHVTADDWNPNSECGHGLHLCPTPHHATAYRRDATRWLRCVTSLDELHPINDNGTAKAKVRTCYVDAEVDENGQVLKPAKATA